MRFADNIYRRFWLTSNYAPMDRCNVAKSFPNLPNILIKRSIKMLEIIGNTEKKNGNAVNLYQQNLRISIKNCN